MDRYKLETVTVVRVNVFGARLFTPNSASTDRWHRQRHL